MRTRRAQTDLVSAVHTAAAGEQETNWLEWKLHLNFGEARAKATIAKAVLGFSNRDPDVAARAMEGCAYLLVGVEPGELRSIAPLDQATLEAGVAIYAGPEVDWRADYIELDGNTVLVATVEPPRWGDYIRPVRKAYHPDRSGSGPSMSKGTIFVRHEASTDPASDADIDMLNRRVARRPGSELEVQLRPLPGTELPRLDTRPETINAITAGDEAEYLKRAQTTTVDIRTMEQYEQEVESYFAELRRTLPEVLKSSVVEDGNGKLQLELFNPTDTTFTNVRAEIWLPSSAGVYAWRLDANHAGEQLPERPLRYGQRARAADPLSLELPVPPVPRPAWLPRVDRSVDGVHVAFGKVDVPAEGSARLDEIWVVLDTGAPQMLPVRWEATATPAKKRLRGVVEVPVSDSVLTPSQEKRSPS